MENIYIVGHGSIPLFGSTNNSNVGNGFIAQFDVDFDDTWSTQLLGSGDVVNALAIDKNDNVYITGTVTSGSTNQVGSDVMYQQPNGFGGDEDAFVAKYNTSNQLVWFTYYGGSNGEEGQDIAVTKRDNVYVCGRTSSNNFTTYDKDPNSNVETVYSSLKGGVDAFLLRFGTDGSQQWATYFGGDDDDIGFNLAIDGDYNVYCTGMTKSDNNFPNNTVTSYYDQATIGQDQNGSIQNDAFIAAFTENDEEFWVTYFGGDGTDIGHAIAITDNHKLYLVGSSVEDPLNSQIFPVQDFDPVSTTDVYYGTYNGGARDGFLARFVLTNVVSTEMVTTDEENYLLYPNPTNDVLYLETEIPIMGTLQLFDLSGKKLEEQPVLNQQMVTINLTNYAAGIYICQLISETGQKNYKIIKQ